MTKETAAESLALNRGARRRDHAAGPRSTPSMHIVGVYTIGIPVTDQDRALRFYLDELGFELRVDRPLPNGGRWIEVGPAGAAVTMALVPASEDAPAGVETGIRLKTLDAKADHAQLRARGVDPGEVLRWPGVPPMFMLRDPDGNRLEIIEQQ